VNNLKTEYYSNSQIEVGEKDCQTKRIKRGD